jgi:hypothetical protein
VVVPICDPSYTGGVSWQITPIFQVDEKELKQKRAQRVVQVVKHLPRKYKVCSTNPSTAKESTF